MTNRNRALVGLHSHFDERGHGTGVQSAATNRTCWRDAFAECTSLIRVKMRRGFAALSCHLVQGREAVAILRVVPALEVGSALFGKGGARFDEVALGAVFF